MSVRLIRELQAISREEFVNGIFIINHDYDLPLEVAVSAVVMGERFIGGSPPHTYSSELAATCVVLASKQLDAGQFSHIVEAEIYCDNGAVRQLETSIVKYFQLNLRMFTFLDLLSSLASRLLPNKSWGPNMTQIARTICYQPSVLAAKPITVVLAILYLMKRQVKII